MKVLTSALAVLFALGCGSAQIKKAPDKGSSSHRSGQPSQSELHPQLLAIVRLIDSHKIKRARQQIRVLEARGIPDEFLPYAQLLKARITAHISPIDGADKLEQSVVALRNTQYASEAQFHAGVHAVTVKRCMTAKTMLTPLMNDPTSRFRVDSILAIAPCNQPVEHLLELGKLSPATFATERVRQVAIETMRQVPLEQLLTKIDPLIASSARSVFITGILERFGSELSRKTLEKLQAATTEDSQQWQAISKLLNSGRVGIILPLSGRSAPLGQQIKADLEALAAEGIEDGLKDSVGQVIVDGGQEAELESAFDALASGGQVIGAIGIFDRHLAQAAVKLTTERDLPLIMLTLSDAALCPSCPTWRALHTPLLVARTLVGASLERGAKRYLVMRPDTRYGRRHSHWFRRVVEAAGGVFAGEIVWPTEKAAWGQIAESVKDIEFDSMFIPTDHLSAAQALRHLASVGIWAKGTSSRFGTEEGIREVTVLGTPEWYSDDFKRLAGRYGHHVLIPVPYARETQRGTQLAQQVQRSTGHAPTQLIALLSDAVSALRQANAQAIKTKRRLTDELANVVLNDGVTAGLDFRQKDALAALIVLQLNQDGFRPFEAQSAP